MHGPEEGGVQQCAPPTRRASRKGGPYRDRQLVLHPRDSPSRTKVQNKVDISAHEHRQTDVHTRLHDPHKPQVSRADDFGR